MMATRMGVAVAGASDTTTTTSLIGSIFQEYGLAPSIWVGSKAAIFAAFRRRRSKVSPVVTANVTSRVHQPN